MWEKKRKAQRIAVTESVSGSYANGGAHGISGTTRDVSANGTFFYCEVAPEVGSAIELVLALPPEAAGGHAAQVLCRGRVVRVEATGDKPGVGIAVQFDSIERLPSS